MADEQSVYFAAMPCSNEREAGEYGAELTDRIKQFYRLIGDTGLVDAWGEIHRAYYRGMYNLGKVEVAGKAGNKRKVNINHFRNVFNQVISIITQNRPAMKAIARNTNLAKKSQAQVGDQLLQETNKKKGFENFYTTALRSAALYGEGHFWPYYDRRRGDVVAKISEQPIAPADGEEQIPEIVDDAPVAPPKEIRKGDIAGKFYLPWNFIRSIHEESFEHCEWAITREKVNRYSLAAEYPDSRKRILEQPIERANFWDVWWIADFNRTGHDDKDGIYVYRFYHKKTLAVPNGRYTCFIDDDAILSDGPLDCEYPITVTAGQFEGLPFGYSNTFDVVVLQKIIDAIHSVIVTRVSQFGYPNVVAPSGATLNVENITDGLKWLKYKDGMQLPKLLDFLQLPGDYFKYAQTIQQMMDWIMGASDVGRGSMPEDESVSGRALDILDSRALRYHSDIVNSYSRFLEGSGRAIIRLYQTCADFGFTLTVVGKVRGYEAREFTKGDISEIDTVDVETVNPIYNSFAGKQQRLDYYLKVPGLVTNTKQIDTVFETGLMEPVTDDDAPQEAWSSLIKEKLLAGEKVLSLPGQNPYIVMGIARDVLNSPSILDNGVLAAATLTFNDAATKYMALKPAEVLIFGCPPPPIPPPMMPPPGAPPGAMPLPSPAPMGAPSKVPLPQG